MTIQDEMAAWDGKSAHDIGKIYNGFNKQTGFPGNVIALMAQANCQKAASWLLKHHLENDNKISQLETKSIFKLLNTLDHWESKLHVLQSLPFLNIPNAYKTALEQFLRECLTETNKFVRAWAYNGFYELAKQYPEYEEETRLFFDMAMRDEAPSVRARIRNLLKQGFNTSL